MKDQSIANRVAARHLSAKYPHYKSPELSFVAGEVLPQVDDDIEAFIKTFLKSANALNRKVEGAFKRAQKEVQGGDKVTDTHLVKVITDRLERQWGRDAMLVPLARAIAIGEHLS